MEEVVGGKGARLAATFYILVAAAGAAVSAVF